MSTKCGKPSLGRIQGCVTGRVKWSYWSGGLKYWIKRVIVLGKLSETVRLAEWGVTKGVQTGPLGRILSVNGVPSGTIGQSKRFATMNRKVTPGVRNGLSGQISVYSQGLRNCPNGLIGYYYASCPKWAFCRTGVWHSNCRIL